MEGIIGEIRMFAGNYPPRGWVFCDGQLLSISHNTALFSVIGNKYGGDGKKNFALPNLKGRVPMGCGEGQGLTKRDIGSTGGYSTVPLTKSQLPNHNHVPQCTTNTGAVTNPENAVFANIRRRLPFAYTTSPNVMMAPQAVQPAGGGQPHENMQPYLGLNFIIATDKPKYIKNVNLFGSETNATFKQNIYKINQEGLVKIEEILVVM
ncbi:phage tail protein [Alkaliphilus peptidifermentans]|uniref:Microcystin-dependent protein n=1 Tax=Alkaliphilus peptidifermentans DSM 18978 TaxID=1120976 RepID=A0A1G5JY53_9FIRM|nr:tail fiber protein [Alkaliphilus peptidifermentans]SCY92800.1 Microcystin-dependent protein [Alkaliphilus peptidifermentans DSM 18978]